MLLGVGAVSPAVLAAERERDAHEHGTASLDIALDGDLLYLDLDSPADNVLGFEHAPSTDEQKAAVAEAESVLGTDGVFVADAAAGCTLQEASIAFSFSEEDDDHDDHDEDDHDADGHEEEGHEEEGHEEDGHEEEGHEEDGHDADGHEEEGHEEDGHDADDHEEEGHQEDDHDADGHEEDDHGEEDGHDDEHADHGDEAGTHSDVTVGQVLACTDPDALRTITTTLFDQFGGFRNIDVQLVGPGGQDGASLTADRPSVELEPIL